MMPVGRDCMTCAVKGEDCFCSLPREALADLQTIGGFQRFEAGDRVLNEGFKADRVYVICHGRIKLTASSPEGRLLIVRIAGPGDVLGLSAVLKGTTHKVTAEALEPCEVKAIARTQFLNLMDRYRDVSRNTAMTMALEYEGAILSARRLALSGSAPSKLANVLLDWAKMDGPINGQPMSFRMPLTHEELGSMAALSRETVTRALTKFRKEGLLTQDGETMTLTRPAELERLYS
ncbi:MAG: Crp/Fnr family transcriptional regulator [Edaphobacter sp.]|uniref:Crp/Fnr family transcriptional regulator n=1 Tax=Edaphobacter sp. TaxID=1934404 RepID=UPI002391ABB4|nr:Crp/Fnr family transcriptional regulator [Edaphobacter sp.]MDE1178744.1 Crp/Fnr family transcriptional regulator [Edaphobacter sp.]